MGREKWAETRGGAAAIKTLQNACSAGIERKSGSLEIARVCASQRNVSLRMESLTTSFSTFSLSLSPLLSSSSPCTRYRPRQARHQHLVARLQPSRSPSPPPKDESTCRMRRGASSVIKTLLSLYALRSEKHVS